MTSDHEVMLIIKNMFNSVFVDGLASTRALARRLSCELDEDISLVCAKSRN